MGLPATSLRWLQWPGSLWEPSNRQIREGHPMYRRIGLGLLAVVCAFFVFYIPVKLLIVDNIQDQEEKSEHVDKSIDEQQEIIDKSKSKWSLERRTSPIDDSVTIYAFLSAQDRDDMRLSFACNSTSKEMEFGLEFSSYMSFGYDGSFRDGKDATPIIWRMDGKKAQEGHWVREDRYFAYPRGGSEKAIRWAKYIRSRLKTMFFS